MKCKICELCRGTGIHRVNTGHCTDPFYFWLSFVTTTLIHVRHQSLVEFSYLTMAVAIGQTILGILAAVTGNIYKDNFLYILDQKLLYIIFLDTVRLNDHEERMLYFCRWHSMYFHCPNKSEVKYSFSFLRRLTFKFTKIFLTYI